MHTLADLLRDGRKSLVPIYGRREADALLYHLLEWIAGLKRIDVLAGPEQEITGTEQQQFSMAVGRLQNGEPLQHITGTASFGDLELLVGPEVLIPRPETGELVRWITESHGAPESILDVGTGSGCIALALAAAFPKARVVATDFYGGALETARKNARQNDVGVEFCLHDALLAKTWPGVPYELVVSNPPYIDPAEHATVAHNVLGRDPDAALFAPPGDPLAFYRSMASSADELLCEGGSMYFELQENRADSVQALMEEVGFRAIEIRKDLNGKWRMARGIWLGG